MLLALLDFPYCNGQILPGLKLDQMNTDLITIHMLHRIGAMMTALYLGIFAWFLLKLETFKKIGWLIFAFISLQLILGGMNIIYLRPIGIALLHQTVAIFLLLTVIYALVKVYFESLDARYGS
jgi:cytochrome c oxidase assembly protein subunit 15